MRLLPGKYTAWNFDYFDCVKFNDDHVERYTLPNDNQTK